MFQMDDDRCLSGILDWKDDGFFAEAESLYGPGDVGQPGKRSKITCPVLSCNDLFTKPIHLKRHFAAKHMVMIKKYRCIVMDCHFEHMRDDVVRKHVKADHFDAFTSGEHREKEVRKLCEVVVPNDRYSDPMGVSVPGVNPPQISSQARPVTAKLPSKAVKLSSSSSAGSPSDSNMDTGAPLPETRAALLKEYYVLCGNISSMQQRLQRVKDALKRQELAETQSLKQEMRKKDAELRKLKAKLHQDSRPAPY